MLSIGSFCLARVERVNWPEVQIAGDTHPQSKYLSTTSKRREGAHMATLNIEVSQALSAIESARIPPLNTLTAPEAREVFSKLRSTAEQPSQVHSIENTVVYSADAEIPVRIYTADEKSNQPALIWIHGGGWVLGDLDTADLPCRDLCTYAGCTVVSVDYRLAPEAKFPAAFDDCLAVTNRIFDNAQHLGIDANNIAIGDDSAGGNLAACVALQLARTANRLRAQVLVYPVINNDFSTASYIDNADGYFLTTPMMQWFWDQYVPEETHRSDPRVNPLQADLNDLPDAIVLTVENDPLRDEGLAYAGALQKHNVPVFSIHSKDTIHCYFGMDLDCSRNSRRQVAKRLRSLMAE